MGLRCLIGHDYGEPRTERDRRQRGSEVVVTVREFRECTRCGHRRVLSENKEVTADATTDSASAEAGTTAPGAGEPSAEAAWSPPDDRGSDDAGAAYGGSADEPMTAEEDDGVILEDEPERPPRARGEWPEAEVGEGGADLEEDHEPWPDEEAAAAAAEAAAPAEDADGTEGPADPLDAGPEPAGEPPSPDDEAEPATRSPGADAPAADAEPSAEAAEPESQPSSTPTPRPDPSEVELLCPDCGETWESVNASLRPGDICPECRGGYLDERVIQ